MKKSDYRFTERLRVRWAEVDMQKIVFNGHYLLYFDTAMAGYWRALALPYHDAMARLQGDLYVRKATLEYLGSARYDDLLDVGIRCGRIGNSSLVFDAAVFLGDTRLVHGELVYVFADPATQTSRPVPPPLRELFLAFEAGQDVSRVQLGDWATLGSAARTVRQAVFVDEQRIPADLVCDEADLTAVHAVAFNQLAMPVSAGRLLLSEPGLGQIGRMASLAPVRGSGLGRSVLDALMQAARERGDQALMLHAQTRAVPFYLRAGFRCQGPEIQEAGIAHQEMRLAL